MRRILIALLALCAFGSSAQSARAQEVTVTVASAYYDTDTFNERFSDEPVLKLDATFELGDGFYAAPYVYTGFTHPLNDESSEYGGEIGWEGEVASDTTLNIAGGRYANYQGGGFNQGDWYVRAGITYKRFSISATALAGVTDTVAVHASYALPVAEGFTLSPSVTFLTAGSRVNPGLVGEYAITDSVSVIGTLIAPEDEGGNRHVYAGIALSLSF